MNEKSIQQALRRWFQNHKYVLVNTFVFSWESDFFSVTKTDTVYEVEIKISKGDFRKDFGKGKHQLFRAMAAGQKFVVCRSNSGNLGDLLFRISGGYLHVDSWRRRGMDMEFIDDDSFGYWMQRERFIHLHERTHWIEAPATGIEIIDLEKRQIPNRFYYACPEGLLSKEDVPAYAGLLHIDKDGDIIMIKQAPFIHRRKLLSEKLVGVLLDKFWYLSQNYRHHLRHHNIDFKDCSENKTTEA